MVGYLIRGSYLKYFHASVRPITTVACLPAERRDLARMEPFTHCHARCCNYDSLTKRKRPAQWLTTFGLNLAVIYCAIA